jgi:hypothetical protein
VVPELLVQPEDDFWRYPPDKLEVCKRRMVDAKNAVDLQDVERTT